MWEALRDWDHLRDTLRQDLGHREARARLPRWIRPAAWGAFGVGWALVGWPLLAVPTVLLFEAFVAPGLAPPRQRDLGRLVEWTPPPSFVISPESIPDRFTSR